MPIRGGKAYRQHGSFREIIRERDNHTCQTCGRPGKDVAHIVPFNECHSTTPDNVRVLCHSCNQLERKLENLSLPLDQWFAKWEAEYDRLLSQGALTEYATI